MTAPARATTQRKLWLTTPEMAALIDVHRKTLLHYAKIKRVPPAYVVQAGNRWRWR
jgi:hypothetical protein